MRNVYGNYEDDLLYRPTTNRTWYGGNTHCISPSIARAMQSYERIMKKLSHSVQLETNHCCHNQNTEFCGYRKRKREIARFASVVDACLSNSSLLVNEKSPINVIPRYSINSHSKANVSVPTFLPSQYCNIPNANASMGTKIETSTCVENCFCNFSDNNSQQQNTVLETDLCSQPSKLCPTTAVQEFSVEHEATVIPHEVKEETNCPNSTKNININVEINVKKKKKHRERRNCMCEKKRQSIDDKTYQILQCKKKPMTETSVKKKCVCVTSEPITIIDLQPERKEKFKFLKLFQFCKKQRPSSSKNNQTPNENIFVHTSKPLQADELSKIVENVHDDNKKGPVKSTERKLSENEDDISVIKIKNALKHHQGTRRIFTVSNHSPRERSSLKMIKKPQPHNENKSGSIDNNLANSKQTALVDTKRKRSSADKITVQVFPPSNERRRSSQTKSIVKISKESDPTNHQKFPSFNIQSLDSSDPKNNINISLKEFNQNDDNEQERQRMRHVDSRLVNLNRLSKNDVSHFSSSHQNPKVRTIQLSKHSGRNSKTRFDQVGKKSESNSIFRDFHYDDWLISTMLQMNCMFFRISTDNFMDVKKDKFSHQLYMTQIYNYSYDIEKFFNAKSYLHWLNNYKFQMLYLQTLGNKQNQQIPKGLRIEESYRVNVRKNKFLINKGCIKISYSVFLSALVTIIHVLYFIIFVYFTFL